MYMDMYEMVFPVWLHGCTDSIQAEKICEEAGEVLQALSERKEDGDVSHVVDECIDTIQASLNLIYMIDPECDLQAAIMRNVMKNKRRGYIPQS